MMIMLQILFMYYSVIRFILFVFYSAAIPPKADFTAIFFDKINKKY